MAVKIYKETPKERFLLDLRSTLSRLTGIDEPKLSRAENYLHLGCGPNVVEGMVNADFFESLRFWRRQRKLEWYLDLRYPLNCDKDVFDGVFSEHVLEHLYPDEAMSLLYELFRVMKPGALIRISVPDLERYIDFYNEQLKPSDMEYFRSKFSRPGAALRNLTQNYLHRSLWDYEELKAFLDQAGFVDIARREFRECSEKILCLDQENRKWESLYVEARTPIS